jgi:hypothetical protein
MAIEVYSLSKVAGPDGPRTDYACEHILGNVKRQPNIAAWRRDRPNWLTVLDMPGGPFAYLCPSCAARHETEELNPIEKPPKRPFKEYQPEPPLVKK